MNFYSASKSQVKVRRMASEDSYTDHKLNLSTMLYTFAESVSQVLDHENNLRPYYQHVIWQEHYTLLGTFLCHFVAICLSISPCVDLPKCRILGIIQKDFKFCIKFKKELPVYVNAESSLRSSNTFS